MTITSFSPTARLMFLLAVVGFLTIFTPRVGWAGSYSISSYSGGTYNGGGTYVTSNGQYGHGFGGVCPPGTGGTGTVSGQITATFTWAPDPNNPNDQPPQCAVVTETCTASWSGSTKGSGTCTGSCDNGLGATSVPAQGSLGATSTGTSYTVQNNPGTSFTVQCSPKATFTIGGSGVNSARGNASVWYSASVAGVITQSVTGPTTDGSGNQDILVGQQCSASVSGIPSALLNNTMRPPVYNWSVSGDTFESWSSSTPTSENDTFPTGQATPNWYWKDQTQTSETVKCSITLTPPAGEGSPLTVTTTPQTVAVYVPIWKQETYTLTGTMKVDANCPHQTGVCLYAGPLAGQAGGMNWGLIVSTPQTPVSFGSGSVELVQLIDTQRSYYTNTGTTQPKQGQQYVCIDNGKTGLDTEYPYANETGSGVRATLGLSDSPDIGLDASFYSASLEDSFTDYLMYKPPGNATWVPVASFTWNPSGNATIPASGSSPGDWTKYSGNPGTITTGGNFTGTSTFPSWTAQYSSNDAYAPS